MILGNLIPGFRQLKAMGAAPWFFWIALSALLIGAGLGASGSYAVTRAFFERETLRERARYDKLEKSLADNALAERQRDELIMKEAKERYAEQTSTIAGVADELRRLSSGVRVCASQSTLRLPAAPTGPSQPVASTEPRPADVVLQELAAEFARRADDNAAAFNSLMDRWEKVSRSQEPR